VAALSTVGLAKVDRYLLPTERAVITVRRHWVVVAEPIASVIALFLLASAADVRLPQSLPYVRDVLWLGLIVLIGRMIWKLVSRAEDWFVVTDERLLLTYGLVTRRVAIMPLTKVTDMSYNISPIGRLLGYGEFVFESAGQDQALRTVSFLPDSRDLFEVLSNELFGPEGVASSRRRRGRAPTSED
jgi:membrane protein YdbS with pleckstrin-like domain